MPKMLVEVDAVDMIKELAHNFTDPLELIREAISNSYDAGANNIHISVRLENWHGNDRYVIRIRDDGAGMVLDEDAPSRESGRLRNFFKLGNSMREDNGRDWIGEKGVGIKIAFRSEYVRVRTWAGTGFPIYEAVAEEPWRKLHAGEIPDYDVDEKSSGGESQTFSEIEIVGFFDNDASRFSADELEDYIRWRTKWGSFEQRVRTYLEKQGDGNDLALHLARLRDVPTGEVILEAPGSASERRIPYGHPFPDSGSEPLKANQSLEKAITAAGKLDYEALVDMLSELRRKHWIYYERVGRLEENPDVTWQAIISVEGDLAKRSYNPFLRERVPTGKFAYRTADRYGLWFCKDFFCAYLANDVTMEVLSKEGQRSRFKILFNSPAFRLNADRTSVGSTDAGILKALEDVAKNLISEMINHTDWEWADLIEEEASVMKSEKQDEKQLKERCAAGAKKPTIMLGKKEVMRVPANEAETVLLLDRLTFLRAKSFSFFKALDWRTDKGVDSVVETDAPGETCRFVEFKKTLRSGSFNHTFKHLHYIVCWEVSGEEGSVLVDTAKRQMRLKRHKPTDYDLPDDAPWTLEGKQAVIKVYALKDILLEKLKGEIKS